MRDPVSQRYLNKYVKLHGVPSKSRDPGNNLRWPALEESDSIDEMQMVDINLQNDNDLKVDAESECDNDSVDMSFIKNKDMILNMEGTLMSTKKKSCLLESVSKLETIVESELFNAFPTITKCDSLGFY